MIGRNDIESHNPEQPMENLRPQQIYDALILREIDPRNEIAVMQNSFEIVTDAKHHQVQQADYEIEVIRKGERGWYLSRKIIFSRTDLLPHRQLVYDQDGNLATDSHYEGYKDYDGLNFPSQIEIWRPQEEYDITLTIVKLQLNEPLARRQVCPGAAGRRPGGASGPAPGQPDERHEWECSRHSAFSSSWTRLLILFLHLLDAEWLHALSWSELRSQQAGQEFRLP